MLLEYYGLWQTVAAIAALIIAWKLPEIIRAIKHKAVHGDD